MNVSRLMLPHLPLGGMCAFAVLSCHHHQLWFQRDNVTRGVLGSPRISVCNLHPAVQHFLPLADEFAAQVVVTVYIRSILQA